VAELCALSRLDRIHAHGLHQETQQRVGRTSVDSEGGKLIWNGALQVSMHDGGYRGFVV